MICQFNQLKRSCGFDRQNEFDGRTVCGRGLGSNKAYGLTKHADNNEKYLTVDRHYVAHYLTRLVF